MSKLEIGSVDHDVNLVGKRDAFHVPCVLVTSSHAISPGSWIKLDEGAKSVVPSNHKEADGRADPFVKNIILAGTPFWVMLKPELVEGLVHHFEIKGFTSQDRDAVIDNLKEEVEFLKGERDKALEDLEDERNYDDGCRGCY